MHFLLFNLNPFKNEILVSASSLESISFDTFNLEEDSIMPTILVRKSASSFAASLGMKFSGVGFTSLISAFDPTDTFEDNRRQKPSSVLIPTVMDLESVTTKSWSSILRRTIVSNVDMSKISETKSDSSGRTIQNSHLDRLKDIFNGRFYTTTEINVSLRGLNCADGIASADSSCDAYWLDAAGHVRGISEAKCSTDAPVEACRQAVSEATNMAFAQVKLGVPVDEVLIPILSTTGHLVQFSAMILLLPCFPMVVNLSKVLDLTDDADRHLAAGHLLKIKTFVDTPLSIKFSTKDDLPLLGLSLRLYHLKDTAEFFCSQKEFNASALYFLHVLRRLHKDEICRRFVLFPYCFRQDDTAYQIVFPRLNGFRIGLPTEDDLKESYLLACKMLVSCFLFIYASSS